LEDGIGELTLTLHDGGVVVRKGFEEKELDDCRWFQLSI